MNYKDYFKKEAVNAQLKDEPKLTNVDPAELEKGTKHEMEHATDERTARIIAAQHLKDDPKYYTKLDKAGIDECGFEDEASGLPKVGGALAVPHLGQPIHMSKIIQVGPVGGGPATGALSGMTPAASKKGVNADKGGVKATVDGDREPITAGGKKLDPSIAMKSVGGQVVAGEGEKQGGPNTKGTYANTAKMDGGGSNSCTPKLGQDLTIDLQEHKDTVRNIVKEVLKEITFNKKTGKWERLSENRFAAMNPDNRNAQNPYGQAKMMGIKPLKTFDSPPPAKGTSDPETDPVDRKGDFGDEQPESPIGEAHDEEVGRNAGQSEGGFDPNVFECEAGKSYKGPAGRQYRIAADDQARATQYEPEITEQYDEEEESKLQEQYFRLLTQKHLLKESEMELMKKLQCRLERQRQLREAVNMKMGPSYKKQSHQYRCVDCDPARTNQYDPEMTENDDVADYAADIEKGGDVQQAGEKFLQQIHKDIDADREKGKIHSFDDIDADDVEDINEAGGAATQEKSFRTAKDAPQFSKNRHDGTIDESEKTSQVVQTIKRGNKPKTATKKQKFTYKAPKTTKSGLTKKRK